jgi:hypothetical protein
MCVSARAGLLVAALTAAIVLLATAASAGVRTVQAGPTGVITFIADGIVAVPARGGKRRLIVRQPELTRETLGQPAR